MALQQQTTSTSDHAERDRVVGVLAQQYKGPKAANKQAWFKDVGGQLRSDVISKWLEGFSFSGPG
jgi:hypothetical protein